MNKWVNEYLGWKVPLVVRELVGALHGPAGQDRFRTELLWWDFLFIGLAVYLFICLYVDLFIGLSVYLFVFLSVYLFIYLSVYPFICLSIYLFIHLSVYPFICLSIFVYSLIHLYMFIHVSFSIPPPSTFLLSQTQLLIITWH